MRAATAEAHALGALYGLAAGDALGMPTQFLPRATVAALYGTVTTFQDGPEINEISAGMPAGHVTDDTDQAVILARTLIDGQGTVDPRLLADRLLAWESQMIAIGSADLLGPSTRRALAALTAGADPAHSGRWGDTNGAAMRITPVGIATPPHPLAALCEAVEGASSVTHATCVALAGATAVAAVVSCAIDGADVREALDVGVRAAAAGQERGAYIAGPSVSRRITWAMDLVADASDTEALDLIDTLVGTGVATQEAVPAAFAIAAMAPDDPWRACSLAASLGGDADTIAAMAGAMVGALCGVDALPRAARDRLDEVNRFDLVALAHDLLDLRHLAESAAERER